MVIRKKPTWNDYSMWVFCCLKIMLDNEVYIKIILVLMLDNVWRGKKVKFNLYEKFDYPRAVVSDCSFTNCFAASDSLINEYFDFKPVFSKNRYYRLIRQENNYGLNNMRNPSDFVESNNVKLKETNAGGKKIGSSMPVEWDDSEYTTCKMATTWLNTFNKA